MEWNSNDLHYEKWSVHGVVVQRNSWFLQCSSFCDGTIVLQSTEVM